jgi:hypothetical protein
VDEDYIQVRHSIRDDEISPSSCEQEIEDRDGDVGRPTMSTNYFKYSDTDKEKANII